MVTVSVNGGDLARVSSNAMVFLDRGTRTPFTGIYLRIDPENGITTAGTNMYVAGTDRVKSVVFDNEPEVAEVVIPLGRAETKKKSGEVVPGEGAAELERRARLSAKYPVQLRVEDCAAVTLITDLGTFDVDCPNRSGVIEAYRELLGMFDGVAQRQSVLPGKLTWNLEYFSRFAKVKPATPQAVAADVMFGENPLDAIYVKVGSTFRGLLMPIDSVQYGETVGGDALW